VAEAAEATDAAKPAGAEPHDFLLLLEPLLVLVHPRLDMNA